MFRLWNPSEIGTPQEQIERRRQVDFRFTLPTTWLTSPARVYPVVLDPAIVVTQGDSQDCLIDSAAPTTTFCGYSYIAAGVNGSEVGRALLQFNVQATANTQVLGAEVGLYQLSALNTTPATLELHALTRSWTTSATWTTADGSTAWSTPGGDYQATPAATASDAGSSANGSWLKVFPGALVAGWNDGSTTNDGALIKAANEGTTQALYFCPGGGRGAVNGCTTADEPYLSTVFTYLTGARPDYALWTQRLSDHMTLSVNLANGNLLLESQDVAIRGTGLDLVVDRRYQSMDATGGQDLGNRWMLSTNDRGIWFVDGNPNAVFYELSAGFYVPFFQDAQGNFLSPPGIDATLVKHQDGSYTLTWQHTGVRENVSPTSTVGTSIVDKNGNALTYQYNGGVSQITDTQGRVLGETYGGGTKNWLTKLTDSTNRTVQYGYNTSDDLTLYTDQANQQTQYSYDANHNLTQITDPLGNITQIGYDGSFNGKVTSITLGYGTSVAATYAFRYDTSGGPATTVATVTDPNNNQTKATTDIHGVLTQVTDAAGTPFRYAWTADRHLHQYTDGKGQLFTDGYDQNNNLNSTALPTGAGTSAVYSQVANIPGYTVLTSSTDAQGNTTTYTPDGNGNITAITNQLPTQQQTLLYYNANGTLDHLVDARGNTTHYGYDATGNLRTITPPAPMQPTTIVPDALSRTSSVTDGKGQQRTYGYDALDRLTALQYPASPAQNVGYAPDADGNLLSMTDSTGTTAEQYDARNRWDHQALPASQGGEISYGGYDGAGNFTSYTTSGGTVAYGYNNLNLVTTLTDGSGVTHFGYDQNHRRTSTTYPDGVVQSQGYDASGRLTSISGMSGTTTLSSFSYRYSHTVNNQTVDTMLPWSYSETLRSPSGSVASVNGSMGYDALNRLTSWLVTQQADGSVVHTYSYQFDGVGNRTQIVADPVSGTQHSNESDLVFNAANEIATVQAYSSTGAALPLTTYTYDPAGNQTGNTTAGSPPGLVLQYNGANQTTSITTQSLINPGNPSQGYEPVSLTWSGAGQGERVAEQWTHNGTSYSNSYRYGPLGLSGFTGYNDSNPTSNPLVTSWIIRDPSGVPIAQRYANGTEYYYLFDGQGDVVGLEDPGQMQASYDSCPTGNEADLSGGTNPVTTVGLGNPLRQGAVPYDDGTKDYVSSSGVILEDYTGTGTQAPGIWNLDTMQTRSSGQYAPPGPLSFKTTGVCGSASFGLFFYVSVSACGVGDTNNNAGVAFSVNGGAITGFTASLTNGALVSTASVSQLSGISGSAGVSAGEGAVVGVDVSVGSGGNVTYIASGGAGVIASPLPVPIVEGHGTFGYTCVANQTGVHC